MTIKNVPNATQIQLRKTVEKMEFKDTNVMIVNIDFVTKLKIS